MTAYQQPDGRILVKGDPSIPIKDFMEASLEEDKELLESLKNK